MALFHFMNDPVLLLEALKMGTTKFSVKGDYCFSLVTVNFTGEICSLKCHGGMCVAWNINKKFQNNTKISSPE